MLSAILHEDLMFLAKYENLNNRIIEQMLGVEKLAGIADY